MGQIMGRKGLSLQEIKIMRKDVGLAGLGVTCSPRDPRFADLNPTEVYLFF